MPEPDYSGLVDLAREAEQRAEAARLAQRRGRAGVLADAPGMPDWGRGRAGFLDALAGSVEDVGRFPAKVMGATRGVMEGDPGLDIKPIFDAAQLAFTGGLPMAARGAAGIFGGRLAANADRSALRQAEDMAAKGADPREIYQRTGWFRGSDGEWRFEISDARASYKPPGAWKSIMREVEQQEKSQDKSLPRLSEDFTHAEFEKAYPGLINTIGLGQIRKRGMYGGYDPANKNMYLNPALGRADAKSTILHELQHVVQEREGFGPGGMTSTAEIQPLARAAAPGFQRKASEFISDVERQAFEFIRDRKAAGSQMSEYNLNREFWEGMEPALKREYREALKLARDPDAALSEARFRAYQRIAGETEARNVQQRMNMPKEQRRRVMPWETESYPAEGQVVIPAPQRVLPF